MWFASNDEFFNGNVRKGLRLSLPVDRSNSIRLSARSVARTGSDFNGAGLIWQQLWGAGP